jgi:hypothetical protein
MKDTLLVTLPRPFKLPDGSVAEDAVLRMLTVKERNELSKKFQGNANQFAFEQVRLRLERVGDLIAPIAKEIIDEMPAPVFDELQEGTLALDLGFESLETFRSSEKYDGFRG